MTETEICNLALGHIGEGYEIGNLQTDDSNEASACKRYLWTVINHTLRDFDWPFATKTAVLNAVAMFPTPEWQWSYRLPSDCLRFRRFISGARNLTPQNVIPFRVESDAAGLLLLTDFPFTNANPNVMTLPPTNPEIIQPITNVQIPLLPCYAEYTAKVENKGFYPVDFCMAVSFRLALMILPRLSIGDPNKMRPWLQEMVGLSMSNAMANAANEAQPDQRPDADTIRIRDTYGESFGGL